MFRDRTEAGGRLALRLAEMAPRDPVILALPRGGVPVAAEVARRLGAPLDLVLVRKLGVPGHEELAAGAVAEGEGGAALTIFNDAVLRMIGRTPADFAGAIAAKQAENAQRRARWLGDRAPVPLRGRTAIVIDDGIATGATARAALKAVAARGAAEVILAVPVAPASAAAELWGVADRVICLETPEPFYAVGGSYADFTQVEDAEVARILSGFRGAPGDGGLRRDAPGS
jgi:predicted phosphoribosyltransferase